jgi:hypothetical protein
MNNGFADGNLVLLIGFIYFIFQTLNAVVIVFEEPTVLLYHKTERSVSFVSGVFYDVVYGIAATKAYYMLFKEDKKDIDYIWVMWLFFILYNLIMNFPTFFVNVVIILKEVSLEFFQLLTKTVGGELKPYSLGEADALEGMRDIFWFINPFTWIDVFWSSIFGYKVEDYWEENP